jgi:hypothetical protein
MGWWSTDIMGGDSPLDFEDEIFDICKVEKFERLENPIPGGPTFKQNTISKELIDDNLDKIISMLEKSKYEQHIGYQVLCVLMMRAGSEISESLRGRIKEACQLDEWAQENDERKFTCDALCNALNAYDNINPIMIKSRGLFEVMADKLNTNNN